MSRRLSGWSLVCAFAVGMATERILSSVTLSSGRAALTLLQDLAAIWERRPAPPRQPAHAAGPVFPAPTPWKSINGKIPLDVAPISREDLQMMDRIPDDIEVEMGNKSFLEV